MSFDNKVQQAIVENKLPTSFVSTVNGFYIPLVEKLITQSEGFLSSSESSRPLFVGIQGTQGSGKSTCAEFLKLILTEQYNKSCLVMSIDDFYLTRAERKLLAEQEHPLFATRGVPGTHDISLLGKALDDCSNVSANNPIQVPVFDKTIDDRAPESQWQTVAEPVDIIILEGWCVGVTPQLENELVKPINELETDEDAQKIWRSFVNAKLADEYKLLFARLDYLIALQAPSFECVYEWRLLQEQKLAAKLASLENIDTSNIRIQSEQELTRFISHYERLTRHALKTMPTLADWLLVLNQDHSFAQLIDKHSES